MKKLLVVLLSLGLIVAFGATASAVDLSFSGSYYVVGSYDNNRTLADSDRAYSRASFHQQIRLQPVFKIADGLTFTARMDAMEKTWGSSTWKANYSDVTSSRKNLTSNQKIQESFEWERGFITFKTAVGQFQVGYQLADTWGTSFGDNGTTRPRFQYAMPIGPVTVGFVYEKIYEADSSTTQDTWTDADDDTYAMFGLYKFTGGEAGLLYKYYAYSHSTAKPPATSYKSLFTLVSPYVKAKFGPVYLEAEVDYFFGKAAKFESAGTDVDMETLDAYIKAMMTLGPAYFGGQVGYASGNDPADATKQKEINGGGSSWNPALIIGGDDLADWLGEGRNLGGANGVSTDSAKKNMIMYNVFAGFNPTPKINIETALTYATAVEKPRVGGVEYVSDKIGTEIDLKATYKIFDNLSYMVAAGYLWTGDYYKGANAAAKIDNDYVLLNRLMLTF